MSSPELDLLVLGDCNPDLVVTGPDVTPEFGQSEKLVDSMSLMIGGSAAITAVAAARLGLRVALVAAVGDDPAGELMLGLLSRESVDTSQVIVRAGQATGFTTVLSGGSDRAILTALGAIPTLAAADVALAPARHLHVSSYFLLEASLAAGLADLLHAARAQGTTTSLDTNYDPARRWGDARLTAALAQTDVFLPNEAEALGISGEPDVDAAARKLTARCGSVVVKLGERGALCAAQDTDLRLVSVPPVTPVDTTGAGDCFNAGLITGLLEGLDLAQAATLACAVGAASVTAVGGTGARINRPRPEPSTSGLAVDEAAEMSGGIAVLPADCAGAARGARY